MEVTMACAESLGLSAAALAAEVDALWERYPDPTGRVLNILNDIQDAHRFLPEPALERLSTLADVPLAHLRQMGEFFSYLSLDPVGRVLVTVCDGTACHTKNARGLLESLEKIFGIAAGQTTSDGRVTLRAVGCVGACGIAPVVAVEDDVFGSMTLSRVPDLADAALRLAAERERAAQEDSAVRGGDDA